MHTAGNVVISGHCDKRFAEVREALRINFADQFEIGCCVAVVLDGHMVVDLRAGHRHPTLMLPWEPDTLVNMMSVTKSIGTVCILMLVDRGLLKLDDPIARYWPKFGNHGKAAITVRQALAQLAGIPFLDALQAGDLWKEDKVALAFEQQTPEWEPGTMPCYHSFSIGLLYQQLIRRVDGRSLGRFMADELWAGFDIDYHVGLSPALDSRRAIYVPTEGTPSWDGILGRVPSPLNRAWKSLDRAEDANSPNWRFGEFASANGHGSAHGVARLYGALAQGGVISGKSLLSRSLVEDASAPQWAGREAGTQRHFSFASGFMVSSATFEFGGFARNFGHAGIGGAIAFADPERRLGFCYAPNHMAPVADTGPYATRLIDATYRSLGLATTSHMTPETGA